MNTSPNAIKRNDNVMQTVYFSMDKRDQFNLFSEKWEYLIISMDFNKHEMVYYYKSRWNSDYDKTVRVAI